MTKKEVNNYLKDLNNMNLVRNEIRGLQNIIAQEREAHQKTRTEMEYALVQKDNALAQQSNIIAEYERKYGVLK